MQLNAVGERGAVPSKATCAPLTWYGLCCRRYPWSAYFEYALPTFLMASATISMCSGS